MATPIIYYGNALLSGALFGDNGSVDNPAARVRDGSVNLSYAITASGASQRTGEVNLTSVSAIQPDTVIFPKCALSSGAVIQVIMSASSGAGDADTLVSATMGADTTFYLSDLGATSGNLYWQVSVSGGVSQPLAQSVHEITLAKKYTLPRSPEVSVTRTRVRQFSRIPIPGGQPFVKRNGPMLRQTSMNFVVVSGSEVNALRGFISAVDGGEAFTLSDDLGQVYWAELLDSNVPEQDEAGVSSVSLTFQEIKVE